MGRGRITFVKPIQPVKQQTIYHDIRTPKKSTSNILRALCKRLKEQRGIIRLDTSFKSKAIRELLYSYTIAFQPFWLWQTIIISKYQPIACRKACPAVAVGGRAILWPAVVTHPGVIHPAKSFRGIILPIISYNYFVFSSGQGLCPGCQFIKAQAKQLVAVTGWYDD